MLTSTTLQDRPREFLAATGLPHEAGARVLPASAALSPPDKTFAGTVRQRQVGGGATGVWLQPADTVLFLLVEQQTHPLHTQQFPLMVALSYMPTSPERFPNGSTMNFALTSLSPRRKISRGRGENQRIA